MRLILYIVIIALVFFAPVKWTDVADLLPIETVAVYKEEGSVVLETDSGYKGVGQDAQKALENLKEKTPAIIYLDTAKYLVVAEDAKEQIQELKGYLKEKIRIYIADVRGYVKEASKYLQTHENLPENTMSQKEK